MRGNTPARIESVSLTRIPRDENTRGKTRATSRSPAGIETGPAAQPELLVDPNGFDDSPQIAPDRESCPDAPAPSPSRERRRAPAAGGRTATRFSAARAAPPTGSTSETRLVPPLSHSLIAPSVAAGPPPSGPSQIPIRRSTV